MTGWSSSLSNCQLPCIVIWSPTPRSLRKNMVRKSSPSDLYRRCLHGSCRRIVHLLAHAVQRARWAEPRTNKRRLAIAKRAPSDAGHARGKVPGLADIDVTEANSKTLVQKYLGAMRRI